MALSSDDLGRYFFDQISSFVFNLPLLRLDIVLLNDEILAIPLESTLGAISAPSQYSEALKHSYQSSGRIWKQMRRGIRFYLKNLW
jgi:hypothetical protein